MRRATPRHDDIESELSRRVKLFMQRGIGGSPYPRSTWGRRKSRFLLVRHRMKSRMRAKLHEVKTKVQRRRHLPIPEQGRWLGQVIRGCFAYYAVPTNLKAMGSFRTQLIRTWQRALRRRGQRDRTNWARMKALAKRWIPLARVQHPWPDERFDVRTRGKSPVR